MNILITGANRGLGFELAAEAASRGHHVWAGVRNPASPATGLLELMRQYPDTVTLLPLDVTDDRAVARAAEQAAARSDSLDAIINNAAILIGRERRLEDLDISEIEQSFQSNLYGPMLVVKYFLPLLRKGARQAVINISSEAGSMAGAYGGDFGYALSKCALNMFTAQLRSELSPQGCAVYAVHPGWIRTDMGGASAPGDASESAKGIIDLAERKRVGAQGAWFVDHRGEPMRL